MISYSLKYRFCMAFIMSLLMAAIMSGVIMLSHLGFSDPGFFSAWLNSFILAWPIALPAAFFVAPIAQYLSAKILPPPTS